MAEYKTWTGPKNWTEEWAKNQKKQPSKYHAVLSIYKQKTSSLHHPSIYFVNFYILFYPQASPGGGLLIPRR